MLTIREPIRLKTGRPMQGIRQDMTERIQANYSLMKLAIRKEELLHITSQPAEIYFADSENFQILTNINNQNQQEVRLEVINNLMNRILVAQTENFTYQDTVYISSVLRKLGIRDEKTFMKQVFSLQNEHKETRQLLQSYEKNQEVLLQLLKSEDGQEKSVVTKQQILTEGERRYYIHDEIFKRLETGKIYQDMRQFSKTYLHESLQIYPGEMQVAEQTKVAQNFLLQNIKNEVSGQTAPLYYLSNNQYEYLQEITEEMTQELEEQISAAILLNLAEQSYVLRQKQVEENKHYWYSIARSLFQTSENTWKRYEANLTERKQFSTGLLQVLEEINHVKHLEGEIINNIVEEYYKNLQQWKEETKMSELLLTQRSVHSGNRIENTFSGGSYHLTEDEFQLNFLKEETDETTEETTVTIEQLQKQLAIYDQRNYENYQKVAELEKQQKNVKDRKVNRRKAQMDALRALENPEEVLMEYITADKSDPLEEEREKVKTQIYELFSEETKEIYRQFLAQNKSQHTTYLEHIMTQSNESEVYQDMLPVVERTEGSEETVKTRREELETISRLRASIIRDIKEKISEQLILWKEVQKYPEINLEETVYLQNRAKEVLYTKETQLKYLMEKEETKKHSESIITKKNNETIKTQLTLLKDIQEGVEMDAEESEHLSDRTEKMLHTHEVQYTELKNSVEKQTKRRQEEMSIVNINAQKEVRRQQVELVHKVEEQLINEELLEEIRGQSQKTVKTEQTEETTVQNQREVHQVVQEAVKRIQTNRMEDIEEIVQQSVKRQLNNLSDQVYGKLEKKLQTERKRRGYF